MNTTDRLAPLVAGILIALMIAAGLVYAAQRFTAALEGLSL